MKIFHTADVHLHTKLINSLDSSKSKLRRDEIKATFYSLIAKAREQKVKFFIIAGDLFDNETGIARAKKQFLEVVQSNPQINFLYVNGNHDETCFRDEDLPSNFFTFKKDWTYYNFDNITFAGKTIPRVVDDYCFDGLSLDKERFNIVVLHGEISSGKVDSVDYDINLNALKNKNIDYLALGHIHIYQQGKLDKRGTYVYPGNLDGRSFNELGERGYIELDLEDNKLSMAFVPLSSRIYYEVFVDISHCETENDILQAINQSVCDYDESSLMKIVLTGQVDINMHKDIEYLTQNISKNFFYVKIYDQTSMKIDFEALKGDISIKGEFLRLVKESNEIKEEDKRDVIILGIKALEGEDL